MYIQIESGIYTHVIVLANISRLTKNQTGIMSVFCGASPVLSNFPVTDWNNGRLLDAGGNDVGVNPIQL